MSLEWSIDRVRQNFIDFFVKKEHTFVPSSPVLLPNDDTLLFANAGMNQFKPIFLGTVDPNSELATLKRAVNSQKCIRAGGKHNDLKDVGRDSYHHTMFEMVGTWSFGDYFKVDCIKWAWELLTEEFKLDKSRLYATYFGGEPSLGLEPDLEAKNEWLKYLPEERILASGMKDNFWEMGATGPCGPCSEIHYDKVGNGYGLSRVNQDDPLVIEIWNLVFMQFVREEEGGALKSLPAKHIDTGMGLERLVSILQHQDTNYGIDIFQNLFKSIQDVTKARPFTNLYGKDDIGGVDTAYRIVADHIRTVTIAVSDGVVPSNISRGYVLRRIIRRAVFYGLEKLGDVRGFFSQLVPVVVQLLGDAFPSLKKDTERVISIIKDEETQFSRTLKLGLKRFERIVKGQNAGFVLPGSETAKLFHTYGFPFDLTRRMAKERGMLVDKASHEEAMKQNAGVTASELQKMELLPLHGEAVADLNEDKVPVTDDSAKYQLNSIQGKLLAIWFGRKRGFSDKVDSLFFDEPVDSENPKNLVGLIFDITNFYAEQGGQVFDIGEAKNEKSVFKIEDVQVYGGYVVHYGTPSSPFQVDDVFELSICNNRRGAITNNHTSTHLCNFSLRKTLGDHIEQQGSLVLENRFRFDFNHNKPLTAEELIAVDKIVADRILGDEKVFYQDVALEQAKKINGVRQMFGEKYPDPVRVVSIGVSVEDLLANPTNPDWSNYSIEFCGGTHTPSTQVIQSFAVVSEDLISKGIRRVMCVTGSQGVEAHKKATEIEERINSTLEGKTGNELATASASLLKDLDAEKNFPYGKKLALREKLNEAKLLATKQLKDLEKVFKEKSTKYVTDIVASLESNQPKYLVDFLPIGSNCGLIKTTITNIQKKFPNLPILLLSYGEGKYAAVALTNKDNQQQLPANAWVTSVMTTLNGKGGGRADCAQGVAPGEENQTEQALAAARNFAVDKQAILVLYAGGTFGMKRDETGLLTPAEGSALLERLQLHPDFADCLTDDDTTLLKFQSLPKSDLIDSSRATPKTWEDLADVVAGNVGKFRGIVIIHGTDTLAYSSSALSFILRGIRIPVILTAAQIPVFDRTSDGWGNLSGAVAAVEKKCNKFHRIPGVFVFFNNTLFRGACVRKINASTNDAFGTRHGVPVVGKIRDGGFMFSDEFAPCVMHRNLDVAERVRKDRQNLGVKYCVRCSTYHPLPAYSLSRLDIFPPLHMKTDTGFVRYNICHEVLLVKLFPGLSAESFRSIIAPLTTTEPDGTEIKKPFRGVIFECYGTGNHPPEFANVFEQNIKIFFGLVTQCHEGVVNSNYAVAGGVNRLNNVVTCLDMTSEAAFTKLCVLLGPYRDEHFEDENFRNNIIWKRTKAKLNFSHVGECRHC